MRICDIDKGKHNLEGRQAADNLVKGGTVKQLRVNLHVARTQMQATGAKIRLLYQFLP